MSQSQKLSALEAWTNSIVGIAVSWLLTFYVLPVFGIVMSIAQATEVTACFFVVSTLRSYVLRRIFDQYK